VGWSFVLESHLIQGLKKSKQGCAKRLTGTGTKIPPIGFLFLVAVPLAVLNIYIPVFRCPAGCPPRVCRFPASTYGRTHDPFRAFDSTFAGAVLAAPTLLLSAGPAFPFVVIPLVAMILRLAGKDTERSRKGRGLPEGGKRAHQGSPAVTVISLLYVRFKTCSPALSSSPEILGIEFT
jgi:hypothetical protein